MSGGPPLTDADSHRNYIASLNNLTPVPVPVPGPPLKRLQQATLDSTFKSQPAKVAKLYYERSTADERRRAVDATQSLIVVVVFRG